ncbi:1809_t:CDS:2 [Diversispora eburnea]|uniref:DNA topoisomerase (ATP-hydrolyzing) n=1 Tax=Diversispora eburnea TaxID=1213867 RepID=A0A9N9BYF9_9GLOM|nr:1809_t:CDS:2 [Diversispora eburnea]
MIEKIISDIAIGIPPVINSVSNTRRKKESHSGTRKFVIFVRILDICHELLIQGVTATKRDIYYKDVQLFGSQHTVDQAVEELACLFRVPRACLNVTVSAKGLVAGNLKIYQKDKSLLDCKANSSMATFQYLLSSGIFERFGPCVLITGKGYPDIATRQLVKQLSEYRKQRESKECESKEYENSRIGIPILGFFDNDPYGK